MRIKKEEEKKQKIELISMFAPIIIQQISQRKRTQEQCPNIAQYTVLWRSNPTTYAKRKEKNMNLSSAKQNYEYEKKKWNNSKIYTVLKQNNE